MSRSASSVLGEVLARIESKLDDILEVLCEEDISDDEDLQPKRLFSTGIVGGRRTQTIELNLPNVNGTEVRTGQVNIGLTGAGVTSESGTKCLIQSDANMVDEEKALGLASGQTATLTPNIHASGARLATGRGGPLMTKEMADSLGHSFYTRKAGQVLSVTPSGDSQ